MFGECDEFLSEDLDAYTCARYTAVHKLKYRLERYFGWHGRMS